MATVRSTHVPVDPDTSPMPPWPMRAVTSYGPRREPGLRDMERYDLFLGSGISIDTSLRYWRYLSPKYPMRSRSSN